MSVVRFRPPRGKRRIPPARDRAASDPYGGEHRRRRKALMALLISTGGWPCPECKEWMHPGQRLHLHHRGGLAAKLAGEPGDELMHAACNLRLGAKLGAAITNQRVSTEPSSEASTMRRSREW